MKTLHRIGKNMEFGIYLRPVGIYDSDWDRRKDVGWSRPGPKLQVPSRHDLSQIKIPM